MKALLKKDIPPRAALAVIALVLFASVVTGREKPAPAASPPPLAGPAAPGALLDAAADLDLNQLKRERKDEAIVNLFAPATVASSEATQPAAPPAPVAPPLPFVYLARIIDGDQTKLFVARGDEPYLVEPGQTIAGQYKIERVAADAVTFIYLPLRTRQVLAVPALN